VPLLSDIVSDPKMKEVVQFYSAMTAIGRPLVMGPNVPSDVAAMMRKAFADTMTDPDFLSDARKAHLDVIPILGIDIQKTMEHFGSLSPELIALAKDALSKPN
jgi:hypothetical protein